MKAHLTLLLLTGSLLAGFASSASALDISPWKDTPKSDRNGLANGRLALAGNPATIVLTLSADYGSAHQGKATLLNAVDFRVSWKSGSGFDHLLDLQRVVQIYREVKDGAYRGGDDDAPGDEGNRGGRDSDHGDDHCHRKPKHPSE